MTADQFRNLALSLPESEERAHMGHPDFRVRGKIFATLWPDGQWGMVKLTPQEQDVFVQVAPKIFEPVNGAWGARGCTKVRLNAATKGPVQRALASAWRNTAPKRLVQQFEDE